MMYEKTYPKNYFAVPGILQTVGYGASEYQVNRIIDICCHELNTTRERLRLKQRDNPVLRDRQITMYCIARKTALSLSKIGEYFGQDHATVLNAKRKIEMFIETNDRDGILATAILSKL